jgi:diguanylate cyclase (GGDEF)-like protein
MFNAVGTVTRQGFHTFTRELRLEENYPGIQGIGFAAVIAPGEVERHIEAVRKEGYREYRIWPEDKRDFYTSIVYIEPFNERNQRAFGYDMYTEPARRAAMARARDSGEPAVTAKVTLVQEANTDVQPGFLMYTPVYRKDLPHETEQERRAALQGWVYAPFRMNDFMRELASEYEDDLDIEVYAAAEASPESMLFDSSGLTNMGSTRLSSTEHIRVGDKVWTLIINASPAFEHARRSDRPQLVLQAGISISLMIALLIWLFLDDRARALQAAHQAMQLALYDALTGLPNRKLLDERLRVAMAHARRHNMRLALLFIDLDKFKPVNDNFGHAYGDLLLKEVAKRLNNCMRESDTASRLGGDEFVALLSEIEDEEAAVFVANKILSALTTPYDIAGHTFDISASIGIAIFPWHGIDGKSLMKQADLAMYEAKNNGRSTVRVARGNAASMKA